MAINLTFRLAPSQAECFPKKNGKNYQTFGNVKNKLYLCTRKMISDMTAVQMNVELFHNLSLIADDETLMSKAIKYIKKLVAKKEAMDETEYLMSSPEMAKIIRQGQEDIQQGRGQVIKLEDLWK